MNYAPILISLFKLTNFYVGVLIFISRLHIISYQIILQKVFDILDRWKAKILSFAGFFQLVRFSIQNLISYWVRALSLSQKFVQKLKINVLNFPTMASWIKGKCNLYLGRILASPKKRRLRPSLFYCRNFVFKATLFWRLINSDSLLKPFLLFNFFLEASWKQKLYPLVKD